MLRYLVMCVAVLLLTSGSFDKRPKPTIFIIGDSTVKNGSGKGKGGLWGWGDFLYMNIDTTKISIKNHAIGGRSRSYTERRRSCRGNKEPETLHPKEICEEMISYNSL